MTIQCSRSGIYRGVYQGVQPFNRFPNFVTALKIAINACLLKYHLGTLEAEIGIVVKRVHMFFAYLLQRGIYRLCDCPTDVPQELLNNLKNNSSSSVMEIDFHLNNLLLELREDISKTKLLSNGSNNSKYINYEHLSKYLGLAVRHTDIPNWFRNSLGEILGSTSFTNLKDVREKTSQAYMKNLMSAINLLALHPLPHDSLPFIPFPNANRLLKDDYSSPTSQTQNISTKQHAALLATLLDWILDYAPYILELYKLGCEQLEARNEQAALEVVMQRHSALVDEGKLPEPKITQLHNYTIRHHQIHSNI
jgi:hypothetical protein